MAHFSLYISELCIVIIAYIYFGYPIIIAILARLFPKPVHSAPIIPKVSMIISACNEAPFIANKIRNSLNLAYPADKLEIILSSDGSSDGSEKIAAEHGKGIVKIIHNPTRCGKATAMNRGIALATGDILLFSDARPLYNADAVACLISNFANPDVGLANGSIVYAAQGDSAVCSNNNAYGRFENWLRKNESASGSTMTVHGAMMAVRKELVTPLPANIINDDGYIALKVMRAKKRLVYDQRAIASTAAPVKMAGDMERRYRISAGRFQLLWTKGLLPWDNVAAMWRYASHKIGRLLLPFFLIIAFVFSIIACLSTPCPPLPFVAATIAQIIGYAAAALGGILHFTGHKMSIFRLPYYVFIGTFSSVVGFYRFVFNKQNVMWKRSTRDVQ